MLARCSGEKHATNCQLRSHTRKRAQLNSLMLQFNIKKKKEKKIETSSPG
jgi:hypothetical protein